MAEVPWDEERQDVIDSLRDAFELRRGFWWQMICWNGLSTPQQVRLIERGNLPLGYVPEGECKSGAEVAIETKDDTAPGPRFYCLPCAISYLQLRLPGH